MEKSNTGGEGTFTILKTFGAGVTSFRQTDLYYSQKVYYRIKATGNTGDSPYSSVASATTYPKDYKYKIMPLGDSNTEGGSSSIPAEQKASYRDRLEQLLNSSASKGKYDFVGSEKSGSALMTDTDHAGLGGARNEDLVQLIQQGYYMRWYDNVRMGLSSERNYLEAFSPDIILLHTGTNDISNEGVDNSQQTVDELEKILNEVDKYEQKSGREVTVILAKIIKTVCKGDDCYKGATASKNDIIDRYNAKMEAMANQRIKAGDRLELVDMADAKLVYDYVNFGGDMADRFHPAPKGFDKMAPVWYKVLNNLLNRELTPSDTEAPETTIASKPKALSNSNSASFSFSSNESGVTYQVSIDGGAFANAGNPYTVNGLADGEHTLRVRAIDAAGNTDATPASYTWVIDTKAPSTPVVTTPAEGAVLNTTKPTISGTADAGSTVQVYIGTKSIGTATATNGGKWNLAPATALAEGQHELTAKASDEAGNTSKSSNTRTFTVDTKAPETMIASGPGAATNSSEASFSFSSNEKNVTYEVSLDGGAYSAAESSYTAKGLAEGKHTLAVRATDAAGNTDPTPATHTWEIDSKAPEAPSIAGVSEDRGPLDDDHVTADNTVILYGRAEAGAEVAVLEQGRVIGKTTAKNDGSWEYSHEGTALKQGAYTFTATATDVAGNTSEASADFGVTIELTSPEVTLSTASTSPVKETFSISITFTEEVYDLTVADFEVLNAKLEDFKSTDKVSYTATVVPVANGQVRIKLPAGKVTDLAGNSNKASNLLEITYDASAPQGYAVAFGTDKVDVNNQTNISLQISGAEKGATYFYNVSSNNGGEPVTGSATVAANDFSIPDLDLSGLSDGLLTATLYLVDEAGNQGQEVTSQVEKLTKDITVVQSLTDITVLFKTEFAAIGLPEEVEVSYTDGDKEPLKVTWNQGDYNGEIPGSYVVMGQLELKENTSNSKNMMASVTVVVEPNQPPTELSLSDDTFQPDAQPDEVIGTFSTTDPDDSEFTYTLVNGQGANDNDLFELLNNNELHLRSNQGLSGKSIFSIRVRSTDPYDNVIEKTFTLTKSLYEPEGGIELVNAFSPDGDNINDTWLVPELRYYNSIEVQIFDRAGVLLFKTSDPEKGWDGRGRDGRIIAGSYFYIIQIRDIDLVQKGVLTVLK
nr:Ig-like domain-containing protein [Pontibacter anaerobius]